LKSGNKKAATEQYNLLRPKNQELANKLYFLINKKQPPR